MKLVLPLLLFTLLHLYKRVTCKHNVLSNFLQLNKDKENVSEKCILAIVKLKLKEPESIKDLFNSTYFKIFHSSFKPLAGLLDKSQLLSNIESRDECLSLPRFRYCVVPVVIKGLDGREGLHPMCLPQECTKKDFAFAVNNLNQRYRRELLVLGVLKMDPGDVIKAKPSGEGIVCEILN